MMRPDQIRAALTDRIALICTLSGEAASEPIEGQIAVGCVIRNRVTADLGHDQKPDWWGETYRGICLKSVVKTGRDIGQFSCWWEPLSPNTRRVYQLAEALLTRQPVGANVNQLAWIAEGIIGGALLDLTNGADSYLTTELLKHNPPDWAKPGRATPIAVVGHHTFFRLY